MSNLKKFLAGFKRGVHNFGQTIALIVNSTLLFAVYLLGVGFTSLLAKASKKSFLETKLSKEKGSYYSDLELKQKPTEEHYRQF
ncbi:hypothetical protein KY358_01805 [Candidatus Woesearchaeota archaeon]|nr:hypothetical protein [Candidatus Woesearchaeota archaeon]